MEVAIDIVGVDVCAGLEVRGEAAHRGLEGAATRRALECEQNIHMTQRCTNWYSMGILYYYVDVAKEGLNGPPK